MTPRSSEDNQKIRDERRMHILMASAKVFARKGLAATKISEIAVAAGMSHGLVYHYFPSKEDLYAELVEWASNGSLAGIRRAAATQGTARERLQRVVSMIVSSAESMSDVFLVMSQTTVSDAVPERVKELVMSQGTEGAKAVAQLIAEAKAEGMAVAGSPEQLATIILSTAQGLANFAALYGNSILGGFPAPEVVLRALNLL